MTTKNPGDDQVDAWLDEERWHLEHATVDMSTMLKGVLPGDAIADADVFAANNDPVQLSSLWQSAPLLLVSSSMTCPPSRQLMPALSDFVARYPALQFAMLYVIDAHPDGDLCPYTGTDWLGKDNREQGVHYPQPKTQAERNALALKFRDTVALRIPLLVDNMNNDGWNSLGRVPNAAVLIATDGRCVFCQPWFRPDELHGLLAEAGY